MHIGEQAENLVSGGSLSTKATLAVREGDAGQEAAVNNMFDQLRDIAGQGNGAPAGACAKVLAGFGKRDDAGGTPGGGTTPETTE